MKEKLTEQYLETVDGNYILSGILSESLENQLFTGQFHGRWVAEDNLNQDIRIVDDNRRKNVTIQVPRNDHRNRKVMFNLPLCDPLLSKGNWHA